MSAGTSGSAVTPVNPWRFGAVWTIFFLAFPVAFTGLAFRAVARRGRLRAAAAGGRSVYLLRGYRVRSFRCWADGCGRSRAAWSVADDGAPAIALGLASS